MPTDVIAQLEQDSADHARPFRWTKADAAWLREMGISTALPYAHTNLER
jgi:hypothetical protein